VTELFEYITIAALAEEEFKRNNSRFIGIAFPVSDVESCQIRLDDVRALFPDASHHCSAYRLLIDGKVLDHSDDDGEPLNSAGPPILQVIAGRDLLNVTVIVVRYFGGTKLGVGGLIRAYGDATKLVLDAAEVIVKIPQAHLIIKYPHSITGTRMSVLHRNNVEIQNVEFADLAKANVVLPLAERDGLLDQLKEASAGQVEVEDV
jgi:uncharacterized YigZ family protein